MTRFAGLLVAAAVAVAFETVHFDDLCGDQHSSVVFQPEEHGQCVCFSEGVYDMIYNDCEQKRFRTLYTSCGLIPSVVTITKNQTADQRFLPVLSTYFSLCPEPISSRVKRDAPNNTNAALNESDEDYIGSGQEIGQMIMRDQMELHIENVISKLTGLQKEVRPPEKKGKGSGSNARSDNGGGAARNEGGSDVRNDDELSSSQYPVIKIMEYSKQIMQKTCAVVNPDFFDLALNSFVKLQVETYHIKEPYIGYSTFKRIEQAMTRCLAKAKPHVFVLPERSENENTFMNNTDFICDNKAMTTASNLTIVHPGSDDQEMRAINIPPYANSELEPGKIAEPLIETVWKMLVSAHSYCYMYFSDYFNDHHSYTVSLLPLFTNEVQDVWLNANNNSRGYDVSDLNRTKLYGGMFGDVVKIMKDVDFCTGASRTLSPYPWFMNRPTRDFSNTWKRKKRSADLEEEILKALVSNTHQCASPEVMLQECAGTKLS